MRRNIYDATGTSRDKVSYTTRARYIHFLYSIDEEEATVKDGGKTKIKQIKIETLGKEYMYRTTIYE